MTDVDTPIAVRPDSPAAAPERPRQPMRKRGATARLILLIIVTVCMMLPLYVMISASLKSAQNVGVDQMWSFPIHPDLSGLETAWSRLRPNLLNSLVMVIPATVISSVIGSVNGYLFAKIGFRWSQGVFILIVIGMYIPFQAVLIPMVRFLQSIHLYGTIPGLILVHVVYGLSVTTLIFRNYYVGISNELIEAAEIDGAGVVRAYRDVFLPLSAPGFVVAGIFQFTNIWNDFLFGLVVIPDGTKQPITVALNNLSGTTSVDWNVVMAGALIAAIPTLIIYLFLGRFFVRGLMAGSYR